MLTFLIFFEEMLPVPSAPWRTDGVFRPSPLPFPLCFFQCPLTPLQGTDCSLSLPRPDPFFRSTKIVKKIDPAVPFFPVLSSTGPGEFAPFGFYFHVPFRSTILSWRVFDGSNTKAL